MTCVAELFDFSAEEDDRIIIFNAESDVAVESSSRARMKIWTSNGVLVEEMMIENGYNLVGKQILNGVYLFEFIFEDGLREIKQVIF